MQLSEYGIKKIKKSNYEKKEQGKKIEGKLKFLLIIVIILLIVVLLQFFQHHRLDESLKILFLNDKDKFEWGGITAIVAIISLVITVLITVSKNKADLISKSRIDWLQETKKLMSKYLADVYYYPYLYQKYRQQSNDGKVKEELDDLIKNISETKYLLLMNFSNNADNKQIIGCIKDCSTYVKRCKKMYNSATNEGRISYTIDYTPIDNLQMVSRDYFKREWVKAKEGK